MEIYIIAAIIVVLAAVLGMVFSIKKKRKQLRAFLSSPEPSYRGFKIPESSEYSCECERIVNKKFAAFISICNDLIYERAHKEYLEKRKKAEHYLALDSEKETEKAIAASAKKIEEIRSSAERAHWFNYSPKDSSAEILDLFSRFNALSDSLPGANRPPEPISSFAPKGKKWIDAGGVWILCSEFYVMLFYESDLTVRIVDYAELEVKCDYTVKALPYGVEPREFEEVASKRYKYMTASGKPDKSHQNNPVRFEVYKGFIKMSLGKVRARIDFVNKKDALLLEKKLNAYKRAVAVKNIRKYVDHIFESSILAFRVSDLESQMQSVIVAREEAKILERENAKREREQARIAAKEQREKERDELREKKRIERESAKTARSAEQSLPIEGGLSEDEIALILAERRRREEQNSDEYKAKIEEEKRKAEEEKRAAINTLPEPPISQSGGTRVITNNLFHFNYVVDSEFCYKGLTLRLTDELGNAASDEYTIEPLSPGSRFRAELELLSGVDFDYEKPYYMLVYPIGEDAPIGKLEYKIKITFVSDFDF